MWLEEADDEHYRGNSTIKQRCWFFESQFQAEKMADAVPSLGAEAALACDSFRRPELQSAERTFQRGSTPMDLDIRAARASANMLDGPRCLCDAGRGSRDLSCSGRIAELARQQRMPVPWVVPSALNHEKHH